MLTLNPTLTRRFAELSVRLENPDRNTVVLRAVPTNAGCFNQPSTQLAVKRPSQGQPYLVAVDEDLRYTGSDARIGQVFTAGFRKERWNTLRLTLSASLELPAALEQALALIGFDGGDPQLPESSADERTRGELLPQLSVDLTALAECGELPPTIARDDEVIDVLATLDAFGQTRLPVLVGPSGIGKSNLLHAVAGRLFELHPERRLLVVNLNQLLVGVTFEGEAENLCVRLLDELSNAEEAVLALEHFELTLCSRVPRLLAESLDRLQIPIIGTLLPNYVARFRAQPTLSRRMRLLQLSELSRGETRETLGALRGRIAEHHVVGIDDGLLDVCVTLAEPIPGVQPAKSLALLDAAAARSRVAGHDRMTPDDLYHVAAQMTPPDE